MQNLLNHLYVGNLPVSVDDAQLNDLFCKAGTVCTASVIKSALTLGSTGTGFVEMRLHKECAIAVALFDGVEHLGHRLAVRPATSREDCNTNQSFAPDVGRFGGAGVRGEEPLGFSPRNESPACVTGGIVPQSTIDTLVKMRTKENPVSDMFDRPLNDFSAQANLLVGLSALIMVGIAALYAVRFFCHL